MNFRTLLFAPSVFFLAHLTFKKIQQQMKLTFVNFFSKKKTKLKTTNLRDCRTKKGEKREKSEQKHLIFSLKI